MARAPLGNNGGAGGTLNNRLQAVETLVRLFRFERYVYLGTNGLAVALLLVAAGRLIWQDKADLASLGGLFGSSGVITFSLGRLLHMWDRSVQILLGIDP